MAKTLKDDDDSWGKLASDLLGIELDVDGDFDFPDAAPTPAPEVADQPEPAPAPPRAAHLAEEISEADLNFDDFGGNLDDDTPVPKAAPIPASRPTVNEPTMTEAREDDSPPSERGKDDEFWKTLEEWDWDDSGTKPRSGGRNFEAASDQTSSSTSRESRDDSRGRSRGRRDAGDARGGSRSARGDRTDRPPRREPAESQPMESPRLESSAEVENKPASAPRPRGERSRDDGPRSSEAESGTRRRRPNRKDEEGAPRGRRSRSSGSERKTGPSSQPISDEFGSGVEDDPWLIDDEEVLESVPPARRTPSFDDEDDFDDEDGVSLTRNDAADDDQDADAEDRPRRRRRRRRRGRRPEAGTEERSEALESVESPVSRRAPGEEFDDELDDEPETAHEDDAEEDLEEEERPRRRRRRRRGGQRSESSPASESSAEEVGSSRSASAGSARRSEFEDENEPAREPRRAVVRTNYDDIPTWEEAISYLAAGPPAPQGRSRDQRGRRPPRSNGGRSDW